MTTTTPKVDDVPEVAEPRKLLKDDVVLRIGDWTVQSVELDDPDGNRVVIGPDGLRVAKGDAEAYQQAAATAGVPLTKENVA